MVPWENEILICPDTPASSDRFLLCRQQTISIGAAAAEVLDILLRVLASSTLHQTRQPQPALKGGLIKFSKIPQHGLN